MTKYDKTMTKENRLIIHRAFQCAIDEIRSNRPSDYLVQDVEYSIWFDDSRHQASLKYKINVNETFIELYDDSFVAKWIYPDYIIDTICTFKWNENTADYEFNGSSLPDSSSQRVWKSIIYMLQQFDEIRSKPLFTQKDFIRSLSSWKSN